MDPKRFAQLAGLDPEEREMERAKNVENLIRAAFDHIGLTINYNSYSVHYMSSDREAVVNLEAYSVSLRDLNKLEASGLSDEYHIASSGDGLQVTFKVHPALDDARFAN